VKTFISVCNPTWSHNNELTEMIIKVKTIPKQHKISWM